MLGLDLLAAHLLGDFVLQTEDMARRKPGDWRVRALHVSVYCTPFLLLAWLYGPALTRSALFLVLLWVTHFLTDSRRWAANAAWPHKSMMVDQTIHVATLAVLARLLLPA
jgi:hypothetical protein